MSALARCRPLAGLVPPLLLAVVGSVQIALVGAIDLSPWKGGGFGMFSTVDSPAARFLRAYLVTESGEVPLLIPRGLSRLAARVRTAPTPAALDELAGGLARGRWVRYRLASALQRYRDGLGVAPGGGAPWPGDPAGDGGAEAGYLDLPQLHLVAQLADGEAVAPGNRVLDFREVRVEVWRFSYETRARTLRATRLAAVRASPPAVNAD